MYLQKHERRESEIVGEEWLMVNQPEVMIASAGSLQPLSNRFRAFRLHNPNAAVVTFNERPAAVVAPDSAADRVVELKPLKHRLLKILDC